MFIEYFEPSWHGGLHEKGMVLALLILLDSLAHIGSWFTLSFSKYLLSESSLLGTLLCVGAQVVSKDIHGPSQGNYNQIFPK